MILQLILLLFLIYLLLKYVYSYWKRKGYPYIIPSIPFGNLNPVAKGKQQFGLRITDLYNQTKEPFIGVYLFYQPALLIRDIDLVHKILVEDFNSFHDRGLFNNKNVDPMSHNLFTAPGAEWRTMRNQFSPTFTSGKLKAMFETITDVADRLDLYLKPFAENNNEIEIKDISTRYVTDIIASVIFGFDIDTINEPDHEFRRIGRIFTKPKGINAIRSVVAFMCPKLMTICRFKALPHQISEFMKNMIREAIELREKNNFIRKDFMQLLLQLRNSGQVHEDEDWNIKASSQKQLSIEEAAGQIALFYVAGTETSAGTVAHCIHELSFQPEFQKRLQNEIDEVLARHNNQITYDSLKEMKFLDLCFKETQRMYPGLTIMNRECTKNYQIPESNFTIQKGTSIIIPLHGIHNDAQYFENPKEFIPDRFADDYNPKAFMPFGAGPHNCIAMRLGLLTSKVGIISMLRNYNFKAVGPREIEIDPNAVVLIPKYGIQNIISKRNGM